MCVLFIAAFEFGPGPVCWIYMSEVMNDKGVAVGTFLIWFFTLFQALFTPAMVQSSYFFYIFATLCFLSSIFVIIFVKETKGLNDTELKILYRSDREEILEQN